MNGMDRNNYSMMMLCLFAGWVGIAALALGCGEDPDLPAGAAARVGDHVVTQSSVNHAAVGRVAINHSAETAPPYWPTDLKGCLATLGKRSGNRGAGSDDVEQRCERQRDRARIGALRLLIQGRWYELEARRRGISIPDTRSLVRSPAFTPA